MFVAKSLADGQLPATVGTLYIAPTANAIIKSFVLFNTGSSDQTTNIYITRSGSTRRQLYQTELETKQAVSLVTHGEVWSLSAGDIIEGDTSSASIVDYTIMGAENA